MFGHGLFPERSRSTSQPSIFPARPGCLQGRRAAGLTSTARVQGPGRRPGRCTTGTVQTRWVSDPGRSTSRSRPPATGCILRRESADPNSDPSLPADAHSQPLSRELDRSPWRRTRGGPHPPDVSSRPVDTANEIVRWFRLLFDRLLTENSIRRTRTPRYILDVTAPNGLDLLSGPYRVQIDGATVWAAGPWDLSWSLANP